MTEWDPTAYPHDVVTMRPWEIQQAGQVGAARLVANLDKPDAKHYNRAHMESDWIAQPAAVLCEAAVAKHLNRFYDWSAWTANQHDQYKGAADLDGIEVRRVRTQPKVAVRYRDATAARTVAAAYVDMDNPETVLIYGFLHALTVWNEWHAQSPPTTDYIRVPLDYQPLWRAA